MTTASKPISKMDGVELEEYAYPKLGEIEDLYVLGYSLEATAISNRWKALGHPVAADSWAEAAKQLGLAAEHVEQEIKEVKD